MAKKVKFKSKRAAAKRFKVTATGRVKKYNQNTSHLALSKTTNQKRNLRHARYLNNTDGATIKKLLSR